MFGRRRAIKAENSTGIFISGDNCTIRYGIVDQPTPLQIPFKPNSVTDSVTSLLRWQSQITDLEGRDDEKQKLHTWLKSDACIAFGIITGEGGVGKTRLAFEFALEARDHGWEAGQFVFNDRDQSYAFGEQGVLLIIDYPEERQAQIANLLKVIDDSEEPEKPLRVLFLSRENTNTQYVLDQTSA